jgi:hypothetical protein
MVPRMGRRAASILERPPRRFFVRLNRDSHRDIGGCAAAYEKGKFLPSMGRYRYVSSSFANRSFPGLLIQSVSDPIHSHGCRSINADPNPPLVTSGGLRRDRQHGHRSSAERSRLQVAPANVIKLTMPTIRYIVRVASSAS